MIDTRNLKRSFYNDHFKMAVKSVFGRNAARALEHDPEKWTPVFRKDHAQSRS